MKIDVMKALLEYCHGYRIISLAFSLSGLMGIFYRIKPDFPVHRVTTQLI